MAKKNDISYGQVLNKYCEKQGFTNFNDFKRQLKQNQKYYEAIIYSGEKRNEHEYSYIKS